VPVDAPPTPSEAPEPRPTGTADDEQAILDMLNERATTRLEAQLQDADELATRALAVLAIDVSASALLVSARDDLAAVWPLAACGFAIAIVLLGIAVWPRTFDTGPEPDAFYEEFGGATRLDASRQMLSELVFARAQNAPGARLKGQLFRYGFITSLVAGIATIPVILAS
jgi:hypothetical protein